MSHRMKFGESEVPVDYGISKRRDNAGWLSLCYPRVNSKARRARTNEAHDDIRQKDYQRTVRKPVLISLFSTHALRRDET
jgi:hypothetical protein